MIRILMYALPYLFLVVIGWFGFLAIRRGSQWWRSQKELEMVNPGQANTNRLLVFLAIIAVSILAVIAIALIAMTNS